MTGNKIVYGKSSKISKTFLENVVMRADIHKMSEYQTGKILIRLLLQKHSDLGPVLEAFKNFFLSVLK